MSNNKFKLIAKTFQGVEEELATEVSQLGGEDITIGKRMVSFMGDKELMYRANFFCRTALRILKPIYTFEANNTDELYEKVKEYKLQSQSSNFTEISLPTRFERGFSKETARAWNVQLSRSCLICTPKKDTPKLCRRSLSTRTF